jgi:hypothetical protein
MPGKSNIPKQDQKRVRQGQLFSVIPAEKPDIPPAPSELEQIQLLKELVAAFQNIPQRYCLICKGKIRLGLDGHRPSCPLRKAAELISRNGKALPGDEATLTPVNTPKL